MGSSKQTSVKRKSKHSRCISKNSGRGSRGNSHSKKSRKDKNMTYDFNSLMYNTHHTISSQNRSQNITSNPTNTNKPSRYNQLIGICNPSILYQTQQC